MSDIKLSEYLKAFRIDRPSEWQMDNFIGRAKELEAEITRLRAIIEQDNVEPVLYQWYDEEEDEWVDTDDYYFKFYENDGRKIRKLYEHLPIPKVSIEKVKEGLQQASKICEKLSDSDVNDGELTGIRMCEEAIDAAIRYLHPPTPSPSNVLVEALQFIRNGNCATLQSAIIHATQTLATYSASTDCGLPNEEVK